MTKKKKTTEEPLTLDGALTPKDVKDRLNVSIHTVHELLRKGRLKGFKLIRQWRIRPDDLDEFMAREVKK